MNLGQYLYKKPVEFENSINSRTGEFNEFWNSFFSREMVKINFNYIDLRLNLIIFYY